MGGIMQRMSTYTHGWIDYIASAVFGAIPIIFGWKGTPKYLLEGAAGTAAVYSACTNYELGLVKALPMKAHLAMDAASGCMLIGAALMLDDEEPEVRSTLAGIGLFEILAALTTQTSSMNERGRRGGQTRRRPTRRRQMATSSR
jgi:hypothetical protein